MIRLLAFIILLGISSLLPAQVFEIDCEVLQSLPELRENGFSEVRTLHRINETTDMTNLDMVLNLEPLHLYHGPNGQDYLMSDRMLYQDRGDALECYESFVDQMTACLGDGWTYSNLPYDGSPRIRIFRAEFHPEDGDPSKGMMLVHVRETLSSKEYYVHFSYE